jgi:hypothetical protein
LGKNLQGRLSPAPHSLRTRELVESCEGKVKRHIRLLTELALILPRTLAAIIDGTGRHDATAKPFPGRNWRR